MEYVRNKNKLISEQLEPTDVHTQSKAEPLGNELDH